MTVETDRAMRTVLHLAENYPMCISAKEIAEEKNITSRFTLKILRKLKLAGIVKSIRGNSGGYALNREPNEVTMLDVVHAIEGELCLQKCIENPDNCNMNASKTCSIHKHICGLQHEITQKLKSVSFQQLIDEDESRL